MERRDPANGAILQVTGHPLPSHMEGCRCGALKVDLYGYVEHDNIRARCVCGVWYRGWVDHETLGVKREGRASRFQPSPSIRFAIYRRDKYCCVHCGRPAPRSGDAFGEVRSLLLAYAESERSLATARDAHASMCVQCGQMLPGILQSIPFEVYRRLPNDAKNAIWNVLERGRLTVDHLLPHALLAIDGVVVGGKEAELVRDTLLVTSCAECNWGRSDALERWDEIADLLEHRVLPGLRDAREIKGYAQQIYFRARLARNPRHAG
jgi:5-methylcytosine-specific restriction endonuclease McrA